MNIKINIKNNLSIKSREDYRYMLPHILNPLLNKKGVNLFNQIKINKLNKLFITRKKNISFNYIIYEIDKYRKILYLNNKYKIELYKNNYRNYNNIIFLLNYLKSNNNQINISNFNSFLYRFEDSYKKLKLIENKRINLNENKIDEYLWLNYKLDKIDNWESSKILLKINESFENGIYRKNRLYKKTGKKLNIKNQKVLIILIRKLRKEINLIKI